MSRQASIEHILHLGNVQINPVQHAKSKRRKRMEVHHAAPSQRVSPNVGGIRKPSEIHQQH